MQEVVVVQERFRGPPQSGNGGYVAGLLGALLTRAQACDPQLTAAEVTLRSPVPLDRQLTVAREPAALRVLDAERLIAEARLTTLDLDIPAPPSFAQALSVRAASLALRVGPHGILPGERVGVHPICFCCGAELAADAGLHVYAAPLADGALVAAAWQPPLAFVDSAGVLPPEIIGTALDCPGQFAWYANGLAAALLGRMTLRLDKPVCAENCVVIGWRMGHEGRKHYAGTALFNAQGEL